LGSERATVKIFWLINAIGKINAKRSVRVLPPSAFRQSLALAPQMAQIASVRSSWQLP
jgi:hypothetical protein